MTDAPTRFVILSGASKASEVEGFYLRNSGKMFRLRFASLNMTDFMIISSSPRRRAR